MGCLAVDSAKQTHDVSVTSAALRKESRDRDELLDQLGNNILDIPSLGGLRLGRRNRPRLLGV